MCSCRAPHCLVRSGRTFGLSAQVSAAACGTVDVADDKATTPAAPVIAAERDLEALRVAAHSDDPRLVFAAARNEATPEDCLDMVARRVAVTYDAPRVLVAANPSTSDKTLIHVLAMSGVGRGTSALAVAELKQRGIFDSLR